MSGIITRPPRREIVGTPISCTTYHQVLELMEHVPDDRPLVAAFCNVHSVMTARRNPAVANALRRMDLTCPDGVPLVWALRALGERDQQRVYGPDLMEKALAYGVSRGWRHYLYGSTDETLRLLTAAAERLAPGVKIVGTFSPPFQPLTSPERAAVIQEIRSSGADIVWIGLGMPKQELWAHDVGDDLAGLALMAVGAAFDLLSGRVKQAPDWIQRRGFEWAYRLCQEPHRLWRRYLWNNPAYLTLVARELLQHRLFGRR